jgi:UDP-N-acetylglucosamine 3-dehydrogenase
MNKEKINVAVIGSGFMGKHHVRNYSELENTNLVCIAERDEKNQEFLKKKYNIPVYSDYEDVVKNHEIDAVTIATPTKTHKKIAEFFIKNNINVLIEKPIASSIDEANEIIELAKKHNVKLMIGHIERFNPAIQDLKKRLEAGELGRIFKIDANRIGPYPQRIGDVGVVIDLAVHDIDIMRYLLNAEPKRVFAELGYKLKDENEDLLSAIIRFNNNTISVLNINWLTPTKIRRLHITGERGMFVVNYIDQTLYFYENDFINNSEDISLGSNSFYINEGKMVKYLIQKKEPLKAELEHFVDCIINDKQPQVSGKDGLRALEIALELIKSYKIKEPIKYKQE